MVIKNTPAHIAVSLLPDKPVLLVIGGGSLGAASVNQSSRSNSSELLKEFQVIHICGKGKTDESIQLTGYVQYEYVQRTAS
ncbi:MAG: glycosyltransferase [Ruminococcus sp.]